MKSLIILGFLFIASTSWPLFVQAENCWSTGMGCGSNGPTYQDRLNHSLWQNQEKIAAALDRQVEIDWAIEQHNINQWCQTGRDHVYKTTQREYNKETLASLEHYYSYRMAYINCFDEALNELEEINYERLEVYHDPDLFEEVYGDDCKKFMAHKTELFDFWDQRSDHFKSVYRRLKTAAVLRDRESELCESTQNPQGGDKRRQSLTEG